MRTLIAVAIATILYGGAMTVRLFVADTQCRERGFTHALIAFDFEIECVWIMQKRAPLRELKP